MNQTVAIDAVEERLRAFIESAPAGSSAQEHAERFISRLSSPVRVTLFGRAGRARAAILDVVAQEKLAPTGALRPSVELRYGTEALSQVTHADGSVTEQNGPLDPEVFNDAVLASFERKLPILKRLSFLDAVAEDSEADQRAAIDWSAPRTDIAVWCSANFDAVDQRIWAGVPERIQDHAYLVLTAATPEQAARIKAMHLGEFHDVYAIDLSKPLAESGIKSLTDRLLSHAEMGREADADSALMFLRAQNAEMPVRARKPERTAPAPETVAPAQVVVPEDEDVESISAAAREVFSTGLGFIRERGRTMLDGLSRGHVSPEDIAQSCSEMLVHLSDLLSSHDDGTSSALTDLSDHVMEAENLVILMENESNTQTAAEAVAILLQVRHDFETCLAA